jgi:hypothetical protein
MQTANHVAQVYFGSLRDNDLDRIPYDDDVELWAPLGPNGLSEPIVGAESVRGFLGSVTPLIEHIEIVNLFDGGEWQAGRAILRMSAPPNAVLRVFDVFRLRDGKIVYQENHYDPRPVLE